MPRKKSQSLQTDIEDADFVDPHTGEVTKLRDMVEVPDDFPLPACEVLNRDKPRMPLDAYLVKLMRKNQTVDGRELPDPVPISPPLGFIEQPSMVDHIRAMVRSEHLRFAAEQAGAETFEESDDFDIPDDDEPLSAYDMADDYEPVSHFRTRMEALEASQAGSVPQSALSPSRAPEGLAKPLTAPTE